MLGSARSVRQAAGVVRSDASCKSITFTLTRWVGARQSTICDCGAERTIYIRRGLSLERSSCAPRCGEHEQRADVPTARAAQQPPMQTLRCRIAHQCVRQDESGGRTACTVAAAVITSQRRAISKALFYERQGHAAPRSGQRHEQRYANVPALRARTGTWCSRNRAYARKRVARSPRVASRRAALAQAS